MKTRIIHTKIWSDNFYGELSPIEKFLFLYFLTNENVNIIHCYECPDRKVLFDTGVTRDQLEKAKIKFEQAEKIFFKEGFVLLKNATKYEQYVGEDNEKAKQNLLNLFTPEILDWYRGVISLKEGSNRISDRGVERGVERGGIPPTINHKSEIINNNTGEVVKKGGNESMSYLEEIPSEDIEEFQNKFNLTTKQILDKAQALLDYCKAHGKKYKDYKAFLRTALRNDFSFSRKEVKAYDATQILHRQNGQGRDLSDTGGIQIAQTGIP